MARAEVEQTQGAPRRGYLSSHGSTPSHSQHPRCGKPRLLQLQLAMRLHHGRQPQCGRGDAPARCKHSGQPQQRRGHRHIGRVGRRDGKRPGLTQAERKVAQHGGQHVDVVVAGVAAQEGQAPRQGEARLSAGLRAPECPSRSRLHGARACNACSGASPAPLLQSGAAAVAACRPGAGRAASPAGAARAGCRQCPAPLTAAVARPPGAPGPRRTSR